MNWKFLKKFYFINFITFLKKFLVQHTQIFCVCGNYKNISILKIAIFLFLHFFICINVKIVLKIY